MTQPVEKFDNQRLVTLIGYFATPFALYLGLLAVVLTGEKVWEKSVAMGLLGFAAFFNTVFPRFLTQQAEEKKGWNVKFRLYMNLGVNSIVVFLLGDQFHALWLPLALTPLATAIYGSRRRTLVNAVTASVILLVIQAVRPGVEWTDFAEQSIHVAFIILISLMINGVASLGVRPEHA